MQDEGWEWVWKVDSSFLHLGGRAESYCAWVWVVFGRPQARRAEDEQRRGSSKGATDKKLDKFKKAKVICILDSWPL